MAATLNISRPRLPRLLPFLLVVISFVVCILSLVYFLHGKYYYCLSDAFYYYGLAQNFHSTGIMTSPITALGEGPVTPQIGIVLLMNILLSIGLSKESLFLAVVVVNFVFHCSLIYPLYKTARLVGYRGPWQMVALIAAVLVGRTYFFANLQVLNDGIFNVTTIWLVYCIAALIHKNATRGNGPQLPSKSEFLFIGFATFFSLVGIFFRVQELLIVGSFFITALLYGMYKKSYGLLLVASLLCACSLLVFRGIYALFGVSGFTSQLASIYPAMFARFSEKTLYFIGTYLVFGVALTAIATRWLKEKNFALLFVTLVCLSGIAFVFEFDFNCAPAFQRYLQHFWPLTIMLVLLTPVTEFVGYAMVGLLLLQSLYENRRVPDYFHIDRFYLYVDKLKITCAGKNALLYSPEQYSRMSYYFLGQKCNFGLEAGRDSLCEGTELYFAGPREYLEKELAFVRKQTAAQNLGFKEQSLTPEYIDEVGDAVVRIYNVNKQSDTF